MSLPFFSRVEDVYSRYGENRYTCTARERSCFSSQKASIFINSDLLPEVISGGRLLPLRFQL